MFRQTYIHRNAIMSTPNILNPHPGDILLKDFLQPLSLNPQDLASGIHIPSAQIDDIINGEQDITTDLALRLAVFLGTSPEFWLNLQMSHDLAKTRIHIAQELSQISFYPPAQTLPSATQNTTAPQSLCPPEALTEDSSYLDKVSPLLDECPVPSSTPDPKVIFHLIKGLQHYNETLTYREGQVLLSRVDILLQDIETLNPLPETGLLLMGEFFKTDQAILEHTDEDCYDVLYNHAAIILAHHAKCCTDRPKVLTLLADLIRHNDYGIRSLITDHLEDCLTAAEQRLLKHMLDN